MEARIKKERRAINQMPKLKSLLDKYRQDKKLRSGLLQLSELTSRTTDIMSFYSSLQPIIISLLKTDSFHIALVDKADTLQLTHDHNPTQPYLLTNLKPNDLSKSLTGLVYTQQNILHCDQKKRLDYVESGINVLYDSSCIDWLGVPLKRGYQTIGVIALQSYNSDYIFDKKAGQLLQFIAEHIVTAIDRIKSRELLENNIQQRTKKLTETNQKLQHEIAERQQAVKMHKALLSISEMTEWSNNIDHFYQLIHHRIKTLISAENFYIALQVDGENEVDFPYFIDQNINEVSVKKIAQQLSLLAVNTQRPLLLSDQKMTILFEEEKLVQQTYKAKHSDKYMPKAWLAAPLMDQGKIFGVLAIQHYENAEAYQQSDLAFIQFVSQHIATAICRKRAQLVELQNKDQLERLVDERTKALQVTNLNLRMQIEERRKAEEQLYFEAHHDALTRLPNRAMFAERLSYAIKHLKRHPDYCFAVLFIDLDRFKMINDTLGHHAGDLFLVEISSRLEECVRENDILARLGGDEFVILLDSLQSLCDVEEVAARIINAISQPYEIEGNLLHSNASIGITLCDQHYKDANEILRDADAAMYQAKSLGRGRYVFFDESIRDQLLATMTLEQELRLAIKEKQFELHYQIISDLNNTTTLGFEALLRWEHPVKGLLTPSEFLFLAEETGIILEIEIWVIEEVARQLASWQIMGEHKNAYIGINLSGRYLTQAHQLNKLIELLQKNIPEKERLILEFNESAFNKNSEIALKGLRKLKDFGVKLALDDYGAGQSSFNYLHKYPFEFIKLDRSLIRSLNNNEKNLSLIKALHDLGENFGYRLVAEGIESEEVLDKLHSVGCDFGQGYFINRPAKMSIMIPETIPHPQKYG